MKSKEAQGFSVVECLVAMLILAVGALAVAHSTTQAWVLGKRSVRMSYANQLASSKLEELTALNPSSLSESNNTSETGLLYRGVLFNRNTTIVTNPDGSRTVTITVAPQVAHLGSQVTLENTFRQWGNS
jgi:prepilin-type N-terminal cleavage/methylation domain-containing protein